MADHQQNESFEKEPKEPQQQPKKQRLMKNYNAQKQEKIRSANRRAARQCRKRKKVFNDVLESLIKKLKGENQALSIQHQALTSCLKQVLVSREQQQQQPSQPSVEIPMIAPQVLQQQVNPNFQANTAGSHILPLQQLAVPQPPTGVQVATNPTTFPPVSSHNPQPTNLADNIVTPQTIDTDVMSRFWAQQAPPPSG